MRLLGLAVVVVVCAAVAAYVIFADGEGDDDGSPPVEREPRGLRFEGGDLPGTIYLLAGEDALNADLYRARGSLRRVERLTRDGRVSIVAAYGGVVVLSNARGAGSDRLEVANLSGGDALPGELIDPNGQGPDFSPSGKLLYSVPQYTNGGGDAGTRTFMTEPRPGADKRVLFDSKRSVFASWGPGERLAVFSSGDRSVVLDPGRSGRRSVDPGLGRVTGVDTSNTDVMAVEGRGQRLATLPPDGPPRRFESDWEPIGWSPDGRRLLAARRDRLGLMSPTDGSVEEVGRVRGGKVFQAEWITEEG